MSLSGIIDKLIYKKDKENLQTYLKGKFFVYSTLMFFLLCLSAIPYYAIVKPEEINEHPEFFVTNLIILAITIGLIAVYKRAGGRVLLVNILTFFGWVGNYGTYETTGGIFSPDNLWGILISSWVFLVANKKSGFFWFALSGLTMIFFYYAELHGMHRFLADANNLTSGYYFFNYMLAVIFMCLIIYLHERSKDQYQSEIINAKEALENKSRELEFRNKEITDSINYAHKIQVAVLPHDETIDRNIPLSFIYYKPKDIVSGDFYWFHEIDKDNYIFVCADCTGHGVPGAFMTVISSNLLNQTVIDNKIYEPAAILHEVDRLLNITLKQNSERFQGVQDGMDISLLKVNKATKELVFTSAKRPVLFIRDKQVQDIKGSNYKEEDMIYFFTDGYHDQFGGPKGKKFSSKRLKELLFQIHLLTIPEQKQKLDKEIKEWMGDMEQVDDMCVVGIRF
ncbi:MAG: rsbU 5 [Bacteroidetes bacterium]|nr:rsbU 5 [Bacteroidota bacterium]